MATNKPNKTLYVLALIVLLGVVFVISSEDSSSQISSDFVQGATDVASFFGFGREVEVEQDMSLTLRSLVSRFESDLVVLPEAGYCVMTGAAPSYKVIETDSGYEGIEYCKLGSFCDNYFVMSDDEATNDIIEKEFFDFWESGGRYCFSDTATVLSDYKDSRDFLCCVDDPDETLRNCKPNDCEGRVTGATDDMGCPLYANLNEETDIYEIECEDVYGNEI